PLIMLTAREGTDPVLEALQAGADDFVSKAGELAVLAARLRAQLRRRHIEEENRRVVGELAQMRLEAESARAERRLAETRARLRLGGPVRGLWDRGRVEQIVSHLLANALKYGEGRPVEVAVSVEDGRARLEVSDHGIGIAEEVRERIFGRFERAVSVRHYGG